MNSKKLNICVIDDEDDIRKILCEAINETEEMEVSGEADSYETGLALISTLEPDAVFLDIKLIEGDAFQLMDTLKRRGVKIPAIILNTGYSEFEYVQRSINEYRDHVIMVLKKPFWENWNDTKNKIVDAIILFQSKNKRKKKAYTDRVILRSENDTYFVSPNEIYYIEIPHELKSTGKVKVYTSQNAIVVNRTLTNLEEDLPDSFIRVSRYASINLDYLLKFNHSDHVIYLHNSEKAIGVGQNYIKSLMERIS